MGKLLTLIILLFNTKPFPHRFKLSGSRQVDPGGFVPRGFGEESVGLGSARPHLVPWNTNDGGQKNPSVLENLHLKIIASVDACLFRKTDSTS